MDRIDLALLGDCDKVIEWIKKELSGTKSGKLLKRIASSEVYILIIFFHLRRNDYARTSTTLR